MSSTEMVKHIYTIIINNFPTILTWDLTKSAEDFQEYPKYKV